MLAVREFRFLWLAEVSSVCGDQLGRIALSILVFSRTGSAALTGLTYGLTFLPTLVGSVFLTGLADHFRRRNVMIACDGVRAVLLAAVAIPGVPLWLLCVLVAGSTLFNGPFKAGQQALLPEVLTGDRYMLGVSLRQVSIQIAQLSGFALGGALVSFLSPAGTLLADSGTFVISAVLLGCLASRPVRPREGERALSPRGLGRGVAAIMRDRRLLVLVAVGVLNVFHIVPEGIAAPYAHQLGLGHYAVTLILAAAPFGAVIGAFVFGRLVPARRQAGLLGPVAVLAGAVLVPLFVPVGLVWSLVLFAISGGLATIYTMYSGALTAQLAPEPKRGRITGVNSAVLHTSNGLGPMLGGLLAGALLPSTAVAIAGAVSVVLAVMIAMSWANARRRSPMPQAAVSA
ncbi:MFS transporter [Sciscionella sediminilitoris]|uniref:MFS transporter n=1 Tax=Sciscionella sediminilitoris TaxID=1445613 RepID=UPI001E46B8B7|nr:MFS transporter [Sciscionella sp. SE31]